MTEKLKKRAGLCVSLAATALLGGCLSPDIDQMSARVPGMSALLAPRAGAPSEISLFEASTRPKRGSRVSVAAPHYALDMVSVPADHRTGTIERPTFGSADGPAYFHLALNRPLSDHEFMNEVATYISGRVGSNRDVLVYVHGFNTSEREARNRLAQIVTDGRFGGVPVLFAWPADGGPFSYEEEKDRATSSRDALESLLSQLSHVPDIGRIHILAHSMGAWLAMEALREEAIAGHPDLDGRLGQVLLAAPDIDLSVFREQIARLKRPLPVSLFISSRDKALSLSGSLHGDRRLGAMNLADPKQRAELERLGVHVYDLSGYWDGFIGHGAFADLPQAVRSIGARIDAPRPEDAQTTAVIDLGVEKSPPKVAPPSPGIESQPLAPPASP